MENKAEQLQTAVSYLSSVLDEGSLVPRYDEATRLALWDMGTS